MNEIITDDSYKNPESTNATFSGIPVVQQLSIAIGILFIVFGTTYVGGISELVKPPANGSAKQAEAVIPVEEEENSEILFGDVPITAKSAFVWDVASQKALFNKNADNRLALASVTKLMTALVAYELLDTNEKINISTDAILEDGDSGLSGGEVFSFQNLTDFTLIASSNDGAQALAVAAGNSISEDSGADIFVEAMNIRAEEIGLSQTHFNNATGLDISPTVAGGYGSARDMAFLMEYIITHHPDLISLTATGETTVANALGEWHFAENTNSAVDEIPGLIASKTGYTDLAGGNLVIAFEAGLNRPIIIAVLGSTRNDRFSDVVTLSERARDYILGND